MLPKDLALMRNQLPFGLTLLDLVIIFLALATLLTLLLLEILSDPSGLYESHPNRLKR